MGKGGIFMAKKNKSKGGSTYYAEIYQDAMNMARMARELSENKMDPIEKQKIVDLKKAMENFPKELLEDV